MKWEGSRTLLAASCALFVISALTSVALRPAQADTDDIYPPKAADNGKRIYLSAAWHTDQAGARGECQYPNGTARTERTMARKLATFTADYTFTDPDSPGNVNVALSGLTERGFRVRVGKGTPDENAVRSNGWGSNAHVPLHSNADGSQAGTCANRSGSIRGTVQIYNQGDGDVLPGRLKTQLEPVTPGTNDRKCTPISSCTNYSCLVELCGIDAASASYSETEFHDWNNGITFLTEDRPQAGVRIATAIDNHY